MPKKFQGVNSKAAEARARKSAQKEAEKVKKAQEEEDEYWRDDDKHVNKKLQRKEDREKKRLQQIEKKKEIQELHDEEMSKLKSAKPAASKITRHEISSNLQRENEKPAPSVCKVDDDDDGPPIEENLNRFMGVESEDARTVEDAINILQITEEESDKHPEKRMKAAFKKFESERLPALKRENPNLRLTQVKQLLQKEWMKSPENPLVQMSTKR